MKHYDTINDFTVKESIRRFELQGNNKKELDSEEMDHICRFQDMVAPFDSLEACEKCVFHETVDYDFSESDFKHSNCYRYSGLGLR